MILCDPFACNTLVLSIMRNLQELLSQDALPRVSLQVDNSVTGSFANTVCLLLLSTFTWS